MSDEDTTTDVVDETTEDTTTDTTDSPEEPDGETWDPERAKRKIAKLNSEAANLRKRLNETPKVEDVAEKDRRISDLEVTALRYEVAFDLGLPKQIAKRLQGSTREEMVADAQELLDELAPTKRPATRKPTEALRGGLEPDREPEETDTKKLGARIFAR